MSGSDYGLRRYVGPYVIGTRRRMDIDVGRLIIGAKRRLDVDAGRLIDVGPS